MQTQTVILAAGQGKRLLPLTKDIPKALLSVDGLSGITILECQVSFLKEAGIKDIIIVVGYEEKKVRSLIGDGVRYIVNERFATTNSIYSFYLAMPFVKEDVLIINGDVLFHPHILKRLLEAPYKAVICIDTGAYLDEETMKVNIDGEKLMDISKDLPSCEAHAENLGMVRFKKESLDVLKKVVSEMVLEGETNCWIPAAFRRMLRRFPIYCIDVKGIPWIEIDFPEDLEKARKEIFPKIWI